MLFSLVTRTFSRSVLQRDIQMTARDDYHDFKVALNDLKLNSKPLINVLTILAEEKIHHAPQIVRAVEERIIEVRANINFLSNRFSRSISRVEVNLSYQCCMYSIRL